MTERLELEADLHRRLHESGPLVTITKAQAGWLLECVSRFGGSPDPVWELSHVKDAGDGHGALVVRNAVGAPLLDPEKLHRMALGCDDGCFDWSGDRDGMRRKEPGPIHSRHATEYARLTPLKEGPR